MGNKEGCRGASVKEVLKVQVKAWCVVGPGAVLPGDGSWRPPPPPPPGYERPSPPPPPPHTRRSSYIILPSSPNINQRSNSLSVHRGTCPSLSVFQKPLENKNIIPWKKLDKYKVLCIFGYFCSYFPVTYEAVGFNTTTSLASTSVSTVQAVRPSLCDVCRRNLCDRTVMLLYLLG